MINAYCFKLRTARPIFPEVGLIPLRITKLLPSVNGYIAEDCPRVADVCLDVCILHFTTLRVADDTANPYKTGGFLLWDAVLKDA